MSDTLQSAFRFHLEHGGYCTPPGRAACAMLAARAEIRAEELNDRGILRFLIEDDEWSHLSEEDENEREIIANLRAGKTEWLAVTLQTRAAPCERCPLWRADECAHSGWDTVASLCGCEVLTGDRSYIRTVKADLALEADLPTGDETTNNRGARYEVRS